MSLMPISRRVILLTAVFFALPGVSQVLNPGTSANSSTTDALIEIIRTAQKRYVRESWGERVDECFTARDLEKFYADQTLKKVVAEVSADKRFQSIAKLVRTLPASQQREVLDRAASTYKPTWAQLGRIDRSGQTDAGQQAEREIAKAIVALLRPAT